MRAKRILGAFVTILAVISAGPGQEHDSRRSPAEAPKQGTARFGDPTSTARAYQDYKLGIVKEIKPNEVVLDKTPYGDAQPFKLTPKTKFILDGEKSDVSRLRVGDQVFVNAKVNKKTGELTAQVIAWGLVGKNMKGQGVKR
jgi:hypothetical protein